MIYRGTFGTGLFQCIYQAGPAHWAMLPTTLEWHTAALVVLLAGVYWPAAMSLGVSMLVVSFIVAGMQAAQARLGPEHDGPAARLLVALLCYAQPLVRSWARYKTRYLGAHDTGSSLEEYRGRKVSLLPVTESVYWGAAGQDRVMLLHGVLDRLSDGHCGKTVDTGFLGCDLELFCGPWSSVEVRTVQEDHGSAQRLLRVQQRLRLSPPARCVGIVGAAVTSAALFSSAWIAIVSGAALAGALALSWYRGARLRRQVIGLIDSVGAEMGLVACTRGVTTSDGCERQPTRTRIISHYDVKSSQLKEPACPLAE